MIDSIAIIFAFFLLIGFILLALWAIHVLFIRAIVVTELAKRDTLFTNRREGHISYLVEGERLIRYIYKLQGHHIDQTTGDILEGPGDDPEISLSERIFGAQWIGFPPRRIKEYDVMYVRSLRPGDEKHEKDSPDHYKVDTKHEIVTRYTCTTYHAWRQVYSIYIRDIEVKGFALEEGDDKSKKRKKIEGSAQVDIWGTFTITTANARIPVLELNGQWFPHIRDAISGAVSDFVNDLTLDKIRRLDKVTNRKDAAGNAIPSQFEEAVLQASKGPSGTIATTGLEIIAFNAAGIEVEDKAEEVLRNRAVARVEAETRKAKGKGEGDYQREVGAGIADAYTAQVKAIGENPIAASVLAIRERSEALRNARNMQTYVEGGGAPPLVTIPAGQNQPAQVPQSTNPTSTNPKPADPQTSNSSSSST